MSGITIATPYSEGDLLFVSSGFTMDKKRPLYAIRPGAAGDIRSRMTKPRTHPSSGVIAPLRLIIPTTLIYDKVLYVLLDNGRLTALEPLTGKPFYEREKLPAGANFTSSPWACNWPGVLPERRRRDIRRSARARSSKCCKPTN